MGLGCFHHAWRTVRKGEMDKRSISKGSDDCLRHRFPWSSRGNRQGSERFTDYSYFDKGLTAIVLRAS
jgi:hypothetical protein